MATLVLTALGTALGGPIGGALGALIGQQADAAIFRPKGRDGPRLSDLRVQTSSYGSIIPQLFGTMRVAGTIIWATDLIERRSKQSSGKGRPSVTQFSYTVSIAVALSARPIGAIRRIWADGNLLRGGDGAFLERTQFRFYPGSADQAPDALIASALGPASAPAFRGIAYALFEDLDLTAFGNRIPSLTFEVEADPGPVTSGDVVSALVPAIRKWDGGMAMTGYAAAGERVRDALAPLVEVDGLRVEGAADDWRLIRHDSAAAPVDLARFAAVHCASPPVLAGLQRAPHAAIPGQIQLRHFDPARDFQASQQSSEVAGGGRRIQHTELPAAISASDAEAHARRLAVSANDGRVRVRVEAGSAAMALAIGALVVSGGGEGGDSALVSSIPAGRWRVVRRRIGPNGVDFDLVAAQPPSAAPQIADGGIAIIAPDLGAGGGAITLFDLPPNDSAARSVARLLVAGAGDHAAWRGADIWLVADANGEPQPVGVILGAAALGQLDAALPAGNPALIDTRYNVVVQMAHPAMMLTSVDDRALMAGANLAMVAGEALQFGSADPAGPGLWRLSRLLRARGATEDRAGPHPIGSPFVLLGDAAALEFSEAQALAASAAGAMVEWLVHGAITATRTPVPAIGRAALPLSPVHGRAEISSDGGLTISWVRRSRVGWTWRDGVDVPNGESRVRFRVTVNGSGGTDVRETDGETVSIDAATRATLGAAGSIAIQQIGDWGVSPALTMAWNAA